MKFKSTKAYIFAILLSLALSSLFGASVFASATAPTTIVIPNSYEQYYEFNYPIDIDFAEDGSFIVLENDNSDSSHNTLTLYKDGFYTPYSFSAYFPTHARFFNDKVLFLSNSRIKLFDLYSQTVADTGMVASTSFSVYGNVVIANTSSGIDVYETTSSPTGYKFEYRGSLSLSSAPDSLVLADEKQGYFFFNNNIYAFDTEEFISEKLCEYTGSTRYSTYINGEIYYTIKSGVFKCDVEARTIAQVNMTTEYDGNGLAFNGDRLFVTYKDAKAIREIDLSAEATYKENFTLYAITTEGYLVNRISKTAADFAYHGDRLYLLDGNYIKIHDVANDTYASYSLTPFINIDSVVSTIATDGKTIALTEGKPAGTVIKILTVNEDQLELIEEIEGYTSVTDVTVYEGEYYFINNATKDSHQYAEIYRIKNAGNEPLVESVASVSGTGWKITLNIFGEMFLSLQQNEKYYLYSATGDALNEIPSKATDIFADFDANIYYITASGDKLYRFDGAETTSYELELWANAPADSAIKAIELLPQSDEVYVMYNGFILHNAGGLDIITPDKLAIPEDYELEYYDELTVVSVDKGVKLFEVSPNVAGEQTYFEYLGYTSKQGDGKYILIKDFSKYSLIADENAAYIIRAADSASREPLAVTPTSGSRFITNDTHAYKLPILFDSFVNYKIKLNHTVNITGEFTFNGTEFTRIEKDDRSGYLPSAYLKTGIADIATPSHLAKASIARRGATLYSDSARTDKVGTLDYGEIVYIADVNDKTVRILYNGTYYYITSKELQTRTYYAVRNLIVIFILIIGLTATAIFLLRRKVFIEKKKK